MYVVDDWFAAQHSAFYLDGLKKLEKWCKKCVELRRDYVEKSMYQTHTYSTFSTEPKTYQHPLK